MKKITAEELKKLIHSQIQNPKQKWITVEDCIVSKQFVSNLQKVNNADKKYYGFHFRNCTFEGGFCFRLYEEVTSIVIKNCIFKKSLTIENSPPDGFNGSDRRLTLIGVKVKGPISIKTKGYQVWNFVDVEADSIDLRERNFLKEVIFGKMQYMSLNIVTPLEKSSVMTIKWCEQFMLPVVAAMFPGVRVEGIFTDTNALRKKWRFF